MMEQHANQSRILIVDDIEENLRVLTDTLTQAGFYPLQAKSGERAIQIALKVVPDLILMDIKMPGMDGYQALEALKADPVTRPIPVIFISALNQTEDKVRGFQAGAVDYVSKPFQKEEVLARVSTHLRLRQALHEVELAKEKTDRLLLNILPKAVAEELKEKGSSAPQVFSACTLLFTDFVDFTRRSAQTPADELIASLNELFTLFDAAMSRQGCERIKTIGDAYFGAAGIPEAVDDHARRICRAALEIRKSLEEWNKGKSEPWLVRMGIHSGPAVGGIVGTTKYIYDVFGDSVNTASRMEAHSRPMGINLSLDTRKLLGPGFNVSSRGVEEVKGKGPMEMFWLEG